MYTGYVTYDASIVSPSSTVHVTGSHYVNVARSDNLYKSQPGQVHRSESLYSRLPSANVTSVVQTATPAALALTPPDGTAVVGGFHTVTTVVRDASGATLPNVPVAPSVAGADNLQGSCTTGTAGDCDFTYAGPALPGADVITACADANANATADPGEPCGTATQAWTAPAWTAGQVTDGGQVYNAARTDKVAFGFTAKSDALSSKGECTLVDPARATSSRHRCHHAGAERQPRHALRARQPERRRGRLPDGRRRPRRARGRAGHVQAPGRQRLHGRQDAHPRQHADPSQLIRHGGSAAHDCPALCAPPAGCPRRTDEVHAAWDPGLPAATRRRRARP